MEGAIVRKVDELGRIVLPQELRNRLDISHKDGVEVFVGEDRVILRKYYGGCLFCKEHTEYRYKNKPICHDCVSRAAADLLNGASADA